MGILAARGEAPKLPGFVWTRVATDIRAVADMAVKLSTMAAVFGQAGIGKTLTLQALHGIIPGSTLITVNAATRTVPGFLEQLARVLNLELTKTRIGNRRNIVRRLKSRGSILIVDEANLCSRKSGLLNCIRELFDNCQPMAVLLSGQASLEKQLLAGRSDDKIGAMLHSRIKIYCDLEERCRGDNGSPLFSVDEVKELFAKSSVRLATESIRWLQALACRPEIGGLRAATGVVQLAECFVATLPEDVNLLLSDD